MTKICNRALDMNCLDSEKPLNRFSGVMSVLVKRECTNATAEFQMCYDVKEIQTEL